MKPLILYHENCIDGFGAAFAAHRRFGDDAEYIPVQYGDDSFETMLQRVEGGSITGRDVYILDFSFSQPCMEVLFKAATKVVWLDHHRSSFEQWKPGEYDFTRDTLENGRIEVLLDNAKSGAWLAWEWFCPDTAVPMLIRHVDDYDRWQFTLSGTKEFQAVLQSHAPWTFLSWESILELELGGLSGYYDLYIEGAAILRSNEQCAASTVKGGLRSCALPVEQDGEKHSLFGLAVNCPEHLVNGVGALLKSETKTFVLCWHVNSRNMVKCSLRSSGEFDVSALAKRFGGGGHKAAAAFRTDLATLMGWLS